MNEMNFRNKLWDNVFWDFMDYSLGVKLRAEVGYQPIRSFWANLRAVSNTNT